MTNNGGTDVLSIALYIMLGVMFVLLIALAFVAINMQLKKKKEEESAKQENNNAPIAKTKSKTFTINSVFDFMEFDKVEDNMIIQKNGTRYVMVVECQGINYDLMSHAEKVGVEEGFVQFLNTLTYPIQLYIQTRKINLENSLNTYKNEIAKVEQEYSRQKTRYQAIISNPNSTEEQKSKLYMNSQNKRTYMNMEKTLFTILRE